MIKRVRSDTDLRPILLQQLRDVATETSTSGLESFGVFTDLLLSSVVHRVRLRNDCFEDTPCLVQWHEHIESSVTRSHVSCFLSFNDPCCLLHK